MSDDFLTIAKCALGLLGILAFAIAAVADELRKIRKAMDHANSKTVVVPISATDATGAFRRAVKEWEHRA